MYQHPHVLPHSSYFHTISKHAPYHKKKNDRGGVDPQDHNMYTTFNKSACTQLFAGMHTAFDILILQNIQHHVIAIFVSKNNDNLVTMMTSHNS